MICPQKTESKCSALCQHPQEEERDLCDRLLTQLKAGTDVRFGDYTMREVDLLNTYQLLTAKPVV